MSIFLATTGSELVRASQCADDTWSVDALLTGQEITCLAADPLHAGVIYAGTRGSGVLRSSDHGATWSATALVGHIVKAISVSRIESGVVYAGAKPALIFVSRDHGRTWVELESFRKIFSRRFWLSPAESPFTAYVQGIALSPTNPNVIIAGIEAGAVVRSTDGGVHWEDHRPGALRDCHSIAFHAVHGDWVYEAGGTGAGTALSRDGGNTWRQNRTGLDRHYGWACAADPLRPETCYISVSPSPFKAHSEHDAEAYIFRMAGNGEWRKLGGGLPQPLNHMPYALLTDPAVPGHVYAGLSNGDVWCSQDLGDTWARLPFNLKSVNRSMIMVYK